MEDNKTKDTKIIRSLVGEIEDKYIDVLLMDPIVDIPEDQRKKIVNLKGMFENKISEYSAQVSTRKTKLLSLLKKNKLLTIEVIGFLSYLSCLDAIRDYASLHCPINRGRGILVYSAEDRILSSNLRDWIEIYFTKNGKPDFYFVFPDNTGGGYADRSKITFDEAGCGSASNVEGSLYLSHYIGTSDHHIKTFKNRVLKNLEELAYEPIHTELIKAKSLKDLGLLSHIEL